MPETKKDAQGNLINEKGERIDDKGNIIQMGKFKLEELPEELKTHLPEEFDSLSQAEQTKELAKVANKAKSADDKEKFIKTQATEVGDLRKFKAEIEPVLEKIKGKKTSTDAIDSVLEKYKDKWDENDLKAISEITKETVALMNKETNKENKALIANVLMDNLETNIVKDPEVDETIYKENNEAILKEYDRFRAPKTIQEMKTNLKEAALKVQGKIVGKMKDEEKKTYEARRDARIAAIPGLAEKGKSTKDTRTPEERQKSPTAEDIAGAGKKGEGGVFG